MLWKIFLLQEGTINILFDNVDPMIIRLSDNAHFCVSEVIFWNFTQKYNDEKIFCFIWQKELYTKQIFSSNTAIRRQYHKNLWEVNERRLFFVMLFLKNVFKCFNINFNNKIKNKTLLTTMKLTSFEFCKYSIKNDKRKNIK